MSLFERIFICFSRFRSFQRSTKNLHKDFFKTNKPEGKREKAKKFRFVDKLKKILEMFSVFLLDNVDPQRFSIPKFVHQSRNANRSERSIFQEHRTAHQSFTEKRRSKFGRRSMIIVVFCFSMFRRRKISFCYVVFCFSNRKFERRAFRSFCSVNEDKEIVCRLHTKNVIKNANHCCNAFVKIMFAE